MDEIENPVLSEIRANENIMSQRLYGVVATLAAAMLPMFESQVATISGADKSTESQAYDALKEFVSLHVANDELKKEV